MDPDSCSEKSYEKPLEEPPFEEIKDSSSMFTDTILERGNTFISQSQVSKLDSQGTIMEKVSQNTVIRKVTNTESESYSFEDSSVKERLVVVGDDSQDIKNE